MTTRKISISNKKKLRHSNKKILRLKLGLIYEYFIYKIIKTKYYYRSVSTVDVDGIVPCHLPIASTHRVL